MPVPVILPSKVDVDQLSVLEYRSTEVAVSVFLKLTPVRPVTDADVRAPAVMDQPR